MLYKNICALIISLFVSNALISNGRFVLTGGGGAGKSTIINLLAQHNYATIPEVWTSFMLEAQQNNCLEHFWQVGNSLEYRKKYMEKQLALENSLDKNAIAFLDRSTVDIIAFGDFYHNEMSDDFRSNAKKDMYDIVFFLDILPAELYCKFIDKYEMHRENSLKAHDFLKSYYIKMGFYIIDVPFDTPENRMNFIVQKAQEYMQRKIN